MSTIGGNFTFATAGTEDTLYGFSYANLKTGALESADTDGFLITSALNGDLYYNTGSTATPTYTKISAGNLSGNLVQVRITGIFINNVKVSGSDPKLYWSPNNIDASGNFVSAGAGANLNGVTSIFTVKAVDNVDGIFGNGNDTFSGDTATGSANLTPVNDAPVITSNGGGASASFSVAENTAGTIATVTATDVDGPLPANPFSISGGVDAGLFSINTATGALSFNPAANFEAPTDSGANNVYNVTVMVDDGAGGTDTQALTITVTNANETPVNSAPANAIADTSSDIAFDGGVGNGHATVISTSDPDNAVVSTTQNLSVDLLLNGAGAGTDTLHITAGGATITGGANDSNHITIQGSQADINAALATLTFNGLTGFGSDNLQVTTTDLDAGFGGGLSDTDNISIAAGNPVVTSVGVPGAAHYNNATNLDFTVVFDQVVVVTGTPQLALDVGGSTLYADYSAGTGTNTLTFTYNIAPADSDSDGIAITSLGLNGGSIGNGIVAADLTLNNVADTSGIIIDNTADVGADATVVINDVDGYIDNTEKAAVSYTLSGVDSDASASVTFHSAGGGADIVVNGLTNGAYSVDLSSLGDGAITASIQVTDTSIAANTAAGTGDTSTLDTTADAGADLSVTINDGDGYIDNSEKAAVSYTVAGLDADATSTVTFHSDGGGADIVTHVGNGTTTVDLSSLGDGAITATISATDTATNTATGTGDTSTKDTTADAAPTATVLIDGGDAYINAAENDTTSPFTVSGLDADVATALVTFSDGTPAHDVIVDVSAGDGAYTVDLTGMDEGTITATLDIADAAGNIATGTGDTIILDTTADAGADLAVTINDGDGYIDNSEKAAVSYTVAGLDGDATSTVTFHSDGGGADIVTHVGNGATTVDLSTLSDGNITASISATDTAGNSANGTGDTSVLDTTADAAPTATVLIDGGDAYINAAENDTTSPFTVSGLDADVATALVTFSDGTPAHDVIVDVSAGDGAYTVDLTGMDEGTITATLDIADAAGNIATGTGDTIVLDTVAPTITTPASDIALNDAALKDGDSATLSVTFSEAVAGFTTADVASPSGGLGAFSSGDNTTFTATFTPNAATTDATNTIDVDLTGVTDLAGNAGVGSASSSNYTVDTVHPTITSFTSTTGNGMYGIGDTVNVTATTSEDVQAGATLDVTLDTGATVTLTYATATTLTGSYVIAEGQASLDLTVASFTAGTVNDTADATGNALTSTALPGTNIATGSDIVVDGIRPTLDSITLDDSALKIGDTATVTFTFSEAVANFDATDVTVEGGSIGAVATGDNIVFTATLTPTDPLTDATNVVSVGTAWEDAAGNTPNAGNTSANYTVDTVRPTVTITLDDTVIKAGDTPTVTFQFSEDVQNFDATDVTAVGSGSLSGFTVVDANTYTATLTPTATTEDATNVVTVGNAWADMADATGNAPAAATTDSGNYTVDTIVPIATYDSVVWDSGVGVLTITGSNMDTLLSFAENASTDVSAYLDFSKMHWDVDGNGSNDFTLAGNVANAYVLDANTLQVIVNDPTAILATANYGSKNGSAWDSLVIDNGFSVDSSGNVAVADAANATIMGDLNEFGMPNVFEADFSDATDLVDETLGLAGVASATFDGSIDSLHISGGVAAADLSVYGTAVAGSSTGGLVGLLDVGSGNTVELNGWNAGSLNGSIITFDDGSVLKTNTGNATTLNGGTGDDLLVAGTHGDRLAGNGGDDMLIGGAGNDQIYGGVGDDTLFGGAGSDFLNGGSGADNFVFDDAAVVNATIADFVSGTDSITLDPGITLSSQVDSGSDNLLLLSNGSTIRLLGQAGVDVSGDVGAGGSFYVDGQDVF